MSDVSSYSVVIPTYRHAELLRYPVESAIEQTVQALEILICGDGMDERTRSRALELADRFPTVRVLDLEKAPRVGEENRDRAVREAAGEAILYLSDDDLWTPRHAEVMLAALAGGAELVVGSALFTRVSGERVLLAHDYGAPAYRRLHEQGLNRAILSAIGHRRSDYPDPVGPWRTTPEGQASDGDLMGRYLAGGRTRAMSTGEVTVLNLPTPLRAGMDQMERAAELEGELEAIRADGGAGLRSDASSLWREMALEFEPRARFARSRIGDLRRRVEQLKARNAELARQSRARPPEASGGPDDSGGAAR